MKVIYAGFPKTGTTTMNAALTELGFTCYDFLENGYYLNEEWEKITLEGGTVEDFRKMYENVDACMDTPCCFFWEEILEAFPDAKIIFGKRKSEDEWWRSLRNQMLVNSDIRLRLMSWLSPTFSKMCNHGINISRACFGVFYTNFYSLCDNELLFKKAYRMHNDYLLKNAPKDKLLVINFEDGWEPLCKFLNVPVPNTPFPHTNKKGSAVLDQLVSNVIAVKAKYEAIATGSLITLFIGLGVFKLATGKPNAPKCLSSVLNGIVNLFKK